MRKIESSDSSEEKRGIKTKEIMKNASREICKICKGTGRVRTDGHAPPGSGRTRCRCK